MKVTRGMFKNCSSLIEINFNRVHAHIFDAAEMFMGCTNLTIANLSELRRMEFMESTFYDCKSLKYLNILNLFTKNVGSFDNIFKGIEKKMEIIYDRKITGTDLYLEIKKNQNLTEE